ncbi:MAG: TonB-dependent receptor [Deltaproteobacteria bacterium]|nr:TonB-dependent receptor [Deltaproteobacteria bacterium]
MRRLRALTVAAVLLVPTLSWAQAGGGLTGTVKDSSGGVVPGATVTLRNTATGELRTSVSTEDGVYRVTNLPRGTYDVTAELTGFRTTTQSGVLVTVGDTVRLDFTLEIGTLGETVTVQSEARLVNTEEGRISALVDERRVAELPLNGRNVFQLMELQPGATGNPGNVVLGGTAGGESAFMNGQRNRANNFLLDGTDNNDQFTAGRVAVNPNVDIVQEFRVSSNNMSAEFGRNSASVVNVVTKQGTNRIAGTAYEFLRNDAFDKKTVFATRKDPLDFNQFGGTVGGPIRRDRTFFFLGYEGLRVTRGTTLVRTVETPEFRAMVARLYPNSIANFLFTNFPSPTPTSNIRDIGRPVAGLANDSTINTPGLVANPNYVLTGGTQYRNAAQAVPDGIPDVGTVNMSVVEDTTTDQFNIRLDHQFSNNIRLMSRYLQDDRIRDDLQAVPRPGFNQPIAEEGKNLTVGMTQLISNRTVHEARFGYVKRTRGLLANNAGAPSISFDDGVLSFGNFSTNPAVFTQKTFHWVDTITLSRGDHSFKFGGEIRHVRDDSDFAVRRPGLAFANVLDFAMDEVRAVTILGVNPRTGLIEPNVRNFRFWESGVFFQDDWKILDNLTVNLGLRHEWFGRPSEENGLLTNIILGPGNDIFNRVRTASVGRVDQVVPDDFNNFAPRMGFSWDPLSDGRIAVRGGYGIAYERLFNNSITNIRFNPPDYAFTSATPVTTPSHAGIPIAYGPINPDGTRRNEPITITGPNNNIGVQPSMGLEGNIIGWNPRFGTTTQSLRVPDPETEDAFTHGWFVGVQAETWGGTVLEVNYIGNVGRNYGRLVDYNTVRGDLFDGRLDRLNPTFGGINYRAMLARSEYHGLQMQLNKRYSKGFSGQITYTLGKAMDDGSDVQVGGLPVDARALELEWGPADFDVRHRAAINWLYELPFFRGTGGLTGALLGGWQVNGVTALQSGFPFSVSTSLSYAAGGDYNGDGVNNDRPNKPSFGTTLPNTSRAAYINGLFTAADFPRPAVLGDLPRNAYLGPGFASTDLSLFKDFRLPRRDAKIQFRVEAFNLFNRVNLQRPVGNMAQATFGRSTQSFAAREVQLAIKLVF